MSDSRDQPGDPLESDLRAWFNTAATPVASPSLRSALERLGADTRSTSPVRPTVPAWRRTSGGRLAAVASVLTVVVAAVGFFVIIGQLGPAAPTGSPGLVPSHSAPSEPVASQPAATLAAPSPIDDGGIFGSSGLWTAAGDQLYLSSDYGATWVQRTLLSDVALDATSGDVLSSVFVLDTSHVWTASPAPGSTVPYGGQGPGYDHLYVVVSRTTDGGVTWQSVTIPDDWGGTQPVLTFADAHNGFLLLSGLRGGGGSVVFTTHDGGVTWQRVGGADSLGSIFSASDATTLWAGNQGDAGPVARPVLDVSRDGGRTWADARLPGFVRDIYVNDNPVAPPVFSAQDGAVAVISGSTDDPPDVRFYRTTDGGRTWFLAARTPMNENRSDNVAVIDPTHFVVIDPQAGVVKTTSDGGVTWQQSTSSGLGAAMRVRFWDARDGAAIVQTSNGSAPAAGVLRTTDGGQTWSPVRMTAAALPPSSPSPTPLIPSAPPAADTSTWTPVTLPHVSSTGAFGGPSGGISALPGGGFIDFVPESSTRSLVFTSSDGSQWTQTGAVTGEDAQGITGPVGSDGHVFVALGSEGGGVHYGMQQNGAAWVSTDLRTWTKAPVQDAFNGTGWRSMAGSPAGFVATGYSEAEGGSPAWFSSDGLHWAKIAGDRPSVDDTVEATGISYASGTFVMVGRLNNDAASWTSADGRQWAIHAPQPGGSNVVLEGLVRVTSGFLSFGTGGQQVEVTPGVYYSTVAPWTSPDGATWEAGTSSPALFGAYVSSLVTAPGGYAATGTVGTQSELWTSRDGLNWVAVAGVDLTGMEQSLLVSDGRHVLLWATGSNEAVAFVTGGVDL